jgi:hypothetical protein
MSEPYVDPSWADTEAGVATNIDVNTKCDFEIDTKTATKYSRDKKMQLDKGCKEPPSDKGRGKDAFWDTQEKDDEFRKVADSMDMFRNFGRAMSLLILGTQDDTILDKFNRFLKHLSNWRKALVENHFPPHLVNLLYMPIVFIVMFLNCVRAEISWYIASFTLLSMCMVIIGVILSLVFISCKGLSIYVSNNIVDQESDDEAPQEQ